MAMRTIDIIRAAVGGLWRQKARTALTLLGVAVGSCALAFSLSLGLGLRSLIDNQFRSRDDFWWVTVYPANRGQATIDEKDISPEKVAVKGEMPEERRLRLRGRLIRDYRQMHSSPDIKLITPERVALLKALPDVEEVQIFRTRFGKIGLGDTLTEGQTYAGRLDTFKPALDDRLIRGRLATAADEVTVTELLLYQLGLRTDVELDGALGKTVRVTLGKSEFQKAGALANILTPGSGDLEDEITRSQSQTLTKIADQLPQKIDHFDLTPAEKALVKLVMKRKRSTAATPEPQELSAVAEFRIVGVLRETSKDEEVFDPLNSHTMVANQMRLFLTTDGGEVLFGQFPELATFGQTHADVKVRPGGDLPAVVDGIKADGMDCYSSLKFYQSVKREVTLISAGLNLFALISLLVAAIGITNTLFTSVLERTREIGIWKSLGARDSQILLMFLSEGTALGFLGGGLGLLLGWLLSIPGDGFVRRLIQQQSAEPIQSSTVFEFPLWLCLGTVGFAVLITTGAALYPARRASRVQPVEALRYE